MAVIFWRERRLNKIISSILFKNSGGKWARTVSMTSGLASVLGTPSGNRANASAPKLLVIMIIVFLKSTKKILSHFGGKNLYRICRVNFQETKCLVIISKKKILAGNFFYLFFLDHLSRNLHPKLAIKYWQLLYELFRIHRIEQFDKDDGERPR